MDYADYKKYRRKKIKHKVDEDTLREEVINAYRVGEDNLNMALNAFDGHSIIEKLNDWNRIYRGDIPDDIKVKLSEDDIMFLFKYARAQLKNQISVVNEANIKAEYKAVSPNNKTSRVVSEVYKAVTEYYENKMGKKMHTLRSLLTAGIDGTVFEEVGIEKESFVGDIIDEFDPETGNYTTKEISEVLFHGPRITMHKLHEVLIPNPFEVDIQKQDWIIVRKTITYGLFMALYGEYKGADKVEPGHYYFGTSHSSDPDTYQSTRDIHTTLENEEVEIIRFFRKSDHLHAIFANGNLIWQGPMPTIEYPVARRIHEPVDGSPLIWGMSFMDNIMSEQGLLTLTLNTLAKKQLHASNPILMTESEEDMFSGQKLDVGMVRKVEDIARTQVFQFPGIDGGDINYINTLRESLQNNSNQAQGGGSVTAPGTSEASTARQVVSAQEQAMRVIGLDATYLEDSEAQVKRLFLSMIREFISIPQIELITNKSKSELQNTKYDRTLRVDNQKLLGGKHGPVIIHFYDKANYFNSSGEKITNKKRKYNKKKDKNELVDTGQPKMRDLMGQLEQESNNSEEAGEPSDIVYVPTDIFDKFKFDVQVVPGSSSQDSRAVEQQKRMEFVQTIVPFLGQAVNGVEIASFLAEVYDYDVSRFIKEQQPQQQPEDPETQALMQAEQGVDPMEEGTILQEFSTKE